jgi:oligopeptide/dipeptide ABC transporter ATP-binding protein
MTSVNQYALEVNNLAVEFDTYGGTVKAVRNVSFKLRKGTTLAIVGESGCGKSVTVQSLMGLIPIPPGKITSGSALLDGEEILGLETDKLNQYRGKRIGMIFQDAMSALNPTMTIGNQIAETLIVHRGMDKRTAWREVIDLLALTQISEPERRAHQYPFEFSGGMLQRVMIAMSLACKPEVLIADEPTTALDVTIQAQILNLLRSLQEKQGLSIILITHDLGVVARMAHDVAVMYAGQIVECGSVDDIFYHSAHPYTVGLKEAMPSNKTVEQQLRIIEGSPPDLFAPPPGCAFYARCMYAMKVCEQNPPALFGNLHRARCWLHHVNAPAHPIQQSLKVSGN